MVCLLFLCHLSCGSHFENKFYYCKLPRITITSISPLESPIIKYFLDELERQLPFLTVLWTHPLQNNFVWLFNCSFCKLAFMQEIFSLDISKYSHKLFVLRIALPMFTPDFPFAGNRTYFSAYYGLRLNEIGKCSYMRHLSKKE